MKASSVILGASVVLNLVLLGTIGSGLASGPMAAPAAGQPVAKAGAAVAAPAGPGPQTWASLERGADLAAQRDRLRAEGFPDRLVRAIIAAQIREKYAARRKALEAGLDVPYWKTSAPDPTTAAALRQLAQAERNELRDLFGADPDNFAATNFQRDIPGLGADKAEQLAEISQRYNDQRQDIFSAGRGGMIASVDGQKLAALDKAMHAEFAAVLTPQELEDYDLRASRTANQMQYDLSAFDPTEAEYRALYKLRSAFDDQFAPSYGPSSQDEMRSRMDAQKQLQSDIAAALGPDRYAEYQRATDYNYRQTTQLVARLELPSETADNLYALQKEYQQKQQNIYQSMRTAPADMNAVRQQMTQLGQEAMSRVTTALNGNAQAIEAYKTYGGQWLRNMVPIMRGGGTATVGSSGTTTITRSPGP